MPYPEHLIPSTTKNEIFNYCNQCLLCRWTPSLTDLIDQEGELNLSEIKEEWINSFFSTNFIRCGDNHPLTSTIDDILIEVIDPGLSRTRWEPGKIPPNPREIIYKIHNERGYFYILLGDLNGIKETYPKNVPKNKEKQQLVFNIEVEHYPTLVNFFHFQLSIIADNEPLTDFSRSKWKKEIRHSILGLIHQKAKLFHT